MLIPGAGIVILRLTASREPLEAPTYAGRPYLHEGSSTKMSCRQIDDTLHNIWSDIIGHGAKKEPRQKEPVRPNKCRYREPKLGEEWGARL